MNWFFWRKKEKEPEYDEELETYLKQSQLYPYIKTGLEMIDKALSGEIFFFNGTHIEGEKADCRIDFWYITEWSIRLRIFTKDFDTILEIESTEYAADRRKYEFILRLPMGNDHFEMINIQKTKIYEEFYQKILELHKPERQKGASEARTKHILRQDAKKHRLPNLFK